MMVTPRDLDILRWIGRHGIVTAGQVQSRFFNGQRAAYRRIHALVAEGLLRRDPTHWKEPFVVRLTPAGAGLADVGLVPAALILAEVRHSLALVDLMEGLLHDYPDATVTTERAFRAERLRALREGQPIRGGRIPDGVLHMASGERIAIELDLTSKRAFAIKRVIDAYIAVHRTAPDDDGFAFVWWYVLPGARDRVVALIRDERVDDFITIREWIDDTTTHRS